MLLKNNEGCRHNFQWQLADMHKHTCLKNTNVTMSSKWNWNWSIAEHYCTRDCDLWQSRE